MAIHNTTRMTQSGLLAGLMAMSLLLSACGGEATPTTGTGTTGSTTGTPAAAAAPTNTPVQVGSGSLLVNGAGATFPVPIYSKWFQLYSTTMNKDAAFNYQPVGSGAGITAITAKTVDFGASDAPLTD